MGKGVIIGVSNLVIALLSADPTVGLATYEAPEKVPGAINAGINPNSSLGTLFADNGPYETASTIGEIGLELNVADLPLELQAKVLGHKIVGGVLKRNKEDIPPWVAVGFKSLKSNGKYRYTWLHKGKFSSPEQSNATKGDSIEFQTPTISGSFVARECDGDWEYQIDEDHVDFMASMATNWFNDPYGGNADLVAPTITSVLPATNAMAVAISASVVWAFDEALALSTVTRGNFIVLADVAGTNVAGALAINAARTQVTFTPTTNLAAATAYRAIVSTDVTDLAGNALANAYISKFTTA